MFNHKQQHILVTGGTSFIGKALCQMLAQQEMGIKLLY